MPPFFVEREGASAEGLRLSSADAPGCAERRANLRRIPVLSATPEPAFARFRRTTREGVRDGASVRLIATKSFYERFLIAA
jgi:hypothetical protein